MEPADEARSFREWLDKQGFWFQQLIPPVNAFLNVDSSYIGIFYQEADTSIELVGVISLREEAGYHGFVNAHGLKNYARLDKVAREAHEVFGLVFQLRLDKRGPFPNLYR